MINNKKLFIIYLFLIIVITLLSAAIITGKNKKIIKLEKTNKELKELNTEYKGRLKEVPIVIESVRDSWCNNE